MAQSVNVLVLPKGAKKGLGPVFTRQFASSGPPATWRNVSWLLSGGLTQAQPPFTDAVPCGHVTTSLRKNVSLVSASVTVIVRSTIWRSVPPGAFAAATVLSPP